MFGGFAPPRREQDAAGAQPLHTKKASGICTERNIVKCLASYEGAGAHAYFGGAHAARASALDAKLSSFAEPFAGKMVAIWFPISAFVTLGLEHSVANMFIIPLGIFSGAAVSWKTFFMSNLLPVTLGNIIGGAVAVAAVFSFMFGKLGK